MSTNSLCVLLGNGTDYNIQIFKKNSLMFLPKEVKKLFDTSAYTIIDVYVRVDLLSLMEFLFL